MAKHRRFALAPRVRPIVIRTTKVLKKHAKRHYGGGRRGLFEGKRLGIAAGALLLGFVDKSGISIPELPVIGKAGTIALAAHFLSGGGRNKMMDEVCTAALTIAAYEFGSTGHVVGDDVSGYVAGF
jgi:hypothetical protein